MDSERSAAALSDAALDAEIARAVNVTPPPELLVRVRARVAEERPRRVEYRPWVFAVAALVMTAIAVLPLVWRAQRLAAPTAPLVSRAETRALALPAGQVTAWSAAPPATVGSRATRQSLVAPRPEVLIQQRDRSALYELLGAIAAATAPPPILVDTAPAATPVDSSETVIRPLIIEPLALSAGEQGARP